MRARELRDGDRLLGWAYTSEWPVAQARELAEKVTRLAVRGCPVVLARMPETSWRYGGRPRRLVQIPDEKVVEIRDEEGTVVAAVRRSVAKWIVALPGHMEALARPCECDAHQQEEAQ